MQPTCNILSESCTIVALRPWARLGFSWGREAHEIKADASKPISRAVAAAAYSSAVRLHKRRTEPRPHSTGGGQSRVCTAHMCLLAVLRPAQVARGYQAVIMDFGSARRMPVTVSSRQQALTVQEDAEVCQHADGQLADCVW